MPDLTTDERTLDGIAGQDEDVLALPDNDAASLPKTPRRQPPRPKASAADTRAAVSAVLGLMGRAPGTSVTAGAASAAGSASTGRATIPSARARAAIELLARLGTVEELDAAQVDLKALSRDLFDWSPSAQTKATKSVVKSVASVLLARDESGVSRYPQAVEMLAFASAVAPLLEADRLGRLIDAAPSVASAYAPERYTLRLASVARTLLSRYQDQRREQLLISLWQAAHDGRFWDVTSAVITIGAQNERNQAEAHAAGRDIVERALDGAVPGTLEADKAILSALVEGRLPYNPQTADLVATLSDTAVARDMFEAIASANRKGEDTDPDLAVHASRIAWLEPMQRPETPITWLLRSLQQAITPDSETGEVLIEKLPEKPRSFTDLFPKVDATTYPHPNGARAWDQRALPGVPTVQVRLVRNAQMLTENREYMGNCTYLYGSEMQKGTYALYQLWQGEDCYNAAMVIRNGRWSLREINSRFNRGNVPPEIRDGFNALIGRTPAPEGAEVARHSADPRQFKFNVL